MNLYQVSNAISEMNKRDGDFWPHIIPALIAILILGVFLGFVFMSWPLGAAEKDPATKKPYIAEVLWVYDGDTPTLNIEGKYEAIRLVGVDTPEIKGKCPEEIALAIKARDFAIQFLNGWAIPELTGKRGKYGRLIGRVKNIKGEDLSDALIKNGLGRVYNYYPGLRRKSWCNG
jgi:micrococcal nuclease